MTNRKILQAHRDIKPQSRSKRDGLKKSKTTKDPATELTKEQIVEGNKECVSNANRILADARLLGDHGRYRAAYLMTLHASEELGKAMWLRIALNQKPTDWTKWWLAFKNHAHKQALSKLAREIVHNTEEYEYNWRQIYKQLDEVARNLFAFRNSVMYVSFDEESRTFAPLRQDSELRTKYEEHLEFTDWLATWLSNLR